MPINLFPARVPIGRVQLPNNQVLDVLMTPEYSRALADIFSRIGGASGGSMEDFAVLDAFATVQPAPSDQAAIAALTTSNDSGAQIASMQAQIEALRNELGAVQSYASLAMQLEEIRVLLGMVEDPATARALLTKYAPLNSPTFTGTPAAPTAAVGTNTTQLATTAFARAMLGSPPAIGSVAPAAGAFTTVAGSANATFNGATIGGGAANFYTDATNSAIRPAAAGAGAGTYFQNSAGTVTWGFITVLGLTITAGFGCNGKAAQTAAVSGGTLAGVIAALVANGILSS